MGRFVNCKALLIPSGTPTGCALQQSYLSPLLLSGRTGHAPLRGMIQRGTQPTFTTCLRLGRKVWTASGYEDTRATVHYRLILDLCAVRCATLFIATGDGVTDDTAALVAALNTGHGPTPSTDPFIVYLPPGTYLVTATLPLYFYTFLTASASCRATLLLKPGTFQSKGGYLIDSDVGDEGGEHTNEVSARLSGRRRSPVHARSY